MLDSPLHTAQLRDWFRRIRAGDRIASEELLRATGERIERLAGRLLRGFPNVARWTDTDDVFQGAILRLLHSLRQLDPPPATLHDFLGLAITHIRRELLDLARCRQAAKRRGEASQTAEGVGEHLDPTSLFEEVDELDRWQRFHKELEMLPVEEREVIGLRFYHGWPEARIAALFDVSERTVRRRWVSGCARLAAALGGEAPMK